MDHAAAYKISRFLQTHLSSPGTLDDPEPDHAPAPHTIRVAKGLRSKALWLIMFAYEYKLGWKAD